MNDAADHESDLFGGDHGRAKVAIVELGQHGPFDEPDAFAALRSAGVTEQAHEVAPILQELADVQVIVELGGPVRGWELVID